VSEYSLKFKSSAAKEFRDLPIEIKQRIGIALEQLRQNPRSIGSVKLQGNEGLYRIRVGDYRIVYEIDDSIKSIRITRIRHNRNVTDSY
jgi:mRNA interferase RelE/StbE